MPKGKEEEEDNDILKKVEIIYEDNNVLALNKPVGLMVHGDGRTKEKTLTDWILKKYPSLKNVGEPARYEGKIIPRPGIVHRLDKETSGVILVTKDQKTFEYLKNEFQERRVVKTYIAIVYGKVKEDYGTINRPIGRSTKDFRLRSAQRGARGAMREAVTEYQVVKRVKDFSLINLFPKTGRTHQLRVHLKAVNHPIVCDSLYAPKRECALGLKRMALHASSVEFVAPDGKKIKAEVPLPHDLSEAVAKLQSM